MFTKKEFRDFLDKWMDFLIVFVNLSYIGVPILVGALIWGWRPSFFEGVCVAFGVTSVALIIATLLEEEV